MSSNICRICKRRLTNGTSVELGIGPVCRGSVDNFVDLQGELFMVEAIPNFGDVVCFRDYQDGYHSPRSNVPHRIVKHSPDGFEWGYGGSGPSEFALNILSVFIGQEEAQRGGLYQDFKWQFISTLPHEGGTIKREDILAWIESNHRKVLLEGV